MAFNITVKDMGEARPELSFHGLAARELPHFHISSDVVYMRARV